MSYIAFGEQLDMWQPPAVGDHVQIRQVGLHGTLREIKVLDSFSRLAAVELRPDMVVNAPMHLVEVLPCCKDGGACK